MIDVLDALSVAGSPARANDDVYGTGEESAFVIDGATGLGEALLPGASDAEWVAVEAASLIAAWPGASGLGAHTLMSQVIEALIQRFRAQALRMPAHVHETPFASLAMLRRGPQGLEAVGYGDCRIILADGEGRLQAIGPGAEHRAAEVARARSFAGAGAAALRGAALPVLKSMRDRVNSGPGAALLGPDLRAAPFVQVTPIMLRPPLVGLLMTDGFYALATDYKRYNDHGLLRSALRDGLVPLVREVRQIEAEDQDLRLFPRFKVSDDATALLIRVT